MSGREIYNVLSKCGYLKIERKVYNDWVKTEKSLLGFIGNVNGHWKKDFVIRKINEWVLDRKLPVIIINDPSSDSRFKIKIIRATD